MRNLQTCGFHVLLRAWKGSPFRQEFSVLVLYMWQNLEIFEATLERNKIPFPVNSQ